MDNGRCRMHGGTSSGAPRGNQNARTHGGYASVLRGALDAEDAAVFDGATTDTAESLDETLRALTVREARVFRFVRDHLGGVVSGGIEKALTDIQNAKLRALAAKISADSERRDDELSGVDRLLAELDGEDDYGDD